MTTTMNMLPNDHHPGPRCSCAECQRRYPEVSAPAQPTSKDQFAWLLEIRGCRPLYFGPNKVTGYWTDCTYNHNEAVRFQRKEDALAAAEWLRVTNANSDADPPRDFVPVEHGWMDRAAPEPHAQSSKERDDPPKFSEYEADWSKRGYEPHVATLLAKADWCQDMIAWQKGEIERLHGELEHMADMQLSAAVNRPAHEPSAALDAWKVAPGDARCVCPGDTAKPINCMSKGRATLVVAAVNAYLASPPPGMLQRYAIRGRLMPLSENGIPQLDVVGEASHEVYLCVDVDRAPQPPETEHLRNVLRAVRRYIPAHKNDLIELVDEMIGATKSGPRKFAGVGELERTGYIDPTSPGEGIGP